MDQTQTVSRQTAARRARKPHPWMTPLQLKAYFLARETLRRLNRAAAASQGGQGKH